MEALHSRGFTSADKVRVIARSLFPSALSGTVAFPRAEEIHDKAMDLPSDPGSGSDDYGPEPGQVFKPINPGNLVNCEPPCHLSPFGPVQYLNHLLSLSFGTQTLGGVLASRRGPLASLLVTDANLNTPVPVIDLVNESLEALAADPQAGHGAIYNTANSGLSELDIPGTPPLVIAPSLTAQDIVRALPQHSAPHLPLDQPTVYDALKTSVAGPNLPYAQGLDFSRTYLEPLGTSRFEVLRTFRRDITELAQDAAGEPDSFQRELWRLPVRYEAALEYLGVSPDEATVIYGGDMAASTAMQLLGLRDGDADAGNLLQVAVLVRVAGITYCEFLELHRSGLVDVGPAGGGEFPECMPCCPDKVVMSFPGERSAAAEILKLVIFVRLWRSVTRVGGLPVSMKILADICEVLGLFTDKNVNPGFLRQLASLLMLQQIWDLPWTSPTLADPSASQPDQRTTLLATWAGHGTDTDEFKWAVEALLHGIEKHSIHKYECPKRPASWHKLIAANLNALAALAGFDTAHTWYSKPTCTIRFVEVLTKLYVSSFTVGEILFLFTTREHLRSDDPFPFTEADESYDDPLNVPEDEEENGLWALRRKLLEVDVDVCDEDAELWTWPAIDAALHEMGYRPHGEEYSLAYLAEHFFPEILQEHGHHVPADKRRFTAPISGPTSAQIWQPANGCSPFHYVAALDSRESPAALWAQLPLRDGDVLHTLRDLRQLTGPEASAVREVYLKPRAALAPFALLFSNFDHAAGTLIQEPCVRKRFAFFRREFARFHRRCGIIARHIHDAVSSAAEMDSAECRRTEEYRHHGAQVARRVLLSLVADENRPASPWEAADDSGVAPAPTDFEWDPRFSGGAFAALLGLAGTGIEGVYEVSQGNTVWKEVRGGLAGWGGECDEWNTPVPTVLPRLTAAPSDDQSTLVSFKNGFALSQASGDEISGAQPFEVVWKGVLLVERAGCYRFAFACPVSAGEHSHHDHNHNHDNHHRHHCEGPHQWSVKMERGQKQWTLLNRGIDKNDEDVSESHSRQVPLRRGAYDITVVFRQPEPDFDDDDDLRKLHTGFRLSYTGPDTHDCAVEVPLKALYIKSKDGPLWTGEEVPRVVVQVLNLRYIPTLRDVRRTYQRAFKAVLFAHRFRLSAIPTHCERESELGYLLSHPDSFRGTSYYWDSQSPPTVKTHYANLDFNFLPVTDAYLPPSATTDQRVQPSSQRQAAMFDWFERIFDYTTLRHEVRRKCEPPLWLLFHHASSDSPQRADQLLRFLAIEIHLAPLALEYSATPDDLFDISADVANLADERWATRVWKSGRWLDRVRQRFYAPVTELALSRPALWATTPDPNAPINTTPPTSGNINLARLVQRSCLSTTAAPPRPRLVARLSDGLRVRARAALLAYLGRPVGEESDHLLQDVDAGVGETATRVGDGVAAAQRFVQRAVLGLEPAFPVGEGLLRRWEGCGLGSFEGWRAGRRREWYRENWLLWEEARRAGGSEGGRSLGLGLQSGVTTVATLARDLTWGAAAVVPRQPGKRSVSGYQGFVLGEQRQALDEGLGLMGTPDHSARPTWLTPLKALADAPSSGSGGGGDDGSGGISLKDATVLTPNSVEPPFPAAASLQSIPLWVQAALRLGTRFIRVAASNVPIAAPYGHPHKEVSACGQCSKDHAPVIDEYYFWLQDSRRFDPTDAPAPQNADAHNNVPGVDQTLDPNQSQIDPRTIQADPTSDWDAPTAKMLFWKSEPAVHLHWTRVHMGVLQDPRRSTEAIPLVDADLSSLYLDLRGRAVDSLLFDVKKGDSTTGFRYDIATDTAVPVPEAVERDPPPPLPLPAALANALAAFPYFLYFHAGAPLVPTGTFGTSLLIASSLRADCHYQASTSWLRLAYDPLTRDNSWAQCPDREAAREAVLPAKADSASTDLFSSNSSLSHALAATETVDVNDTAVAVAVAERSRFPQDGTCCDTAPAKAGKARGRAVALEYLETLLLWSEGLLCRNSLEADQQALTLLTVADRVLGPRPKEVDAADLTGGTMTVATFQASSPALNPRLVGLYDAVAHRLAAIRSSVNRRGLPGGALDKDRAIWGSHRRFDVEDHHGGLSDECGTSSCVYSCCQPYRFSAILPKANEWVAITKSTGAALLSAFERADSEALSSLRTAQERQVTELGLDVSKNQYRAADWDVQALDKQMAGAVARLQYYQRLIQDGLIANEMGYVFGTTASMASRTSATISEGVGQGMASVPDMWMGIAGTMGSPLQFQQMPMGNKMGAGFAAAARILNTVADIGGSGAGLHATQGGWDRREQEWQHECDALVYEIQQIKRQRLAARRRLDVSLAEINITQRRIEHSAEVQDFTRDKLTKHELWLYLAQENAALYRQTYDAAARAAREAQQAARYELGDAELDFIPSDAGAWDSLHEGLLAGEKLELGLRSMERAYMSRNCREYELTKHISLRLHFPAAFVLLKSTGRCEVDVPEWLFDLDYPGHYMRRIRNVSLTIPCVAGPYTGIHCRLQQLSSSIRVRPTVAPSGRCTCCEEEQKQGTTKPPRPCTHDANIATRFAGTEAIATSSGQGDAGLFEVSFSDPRYLPFEYTGAVSRWRIDLPPKNNQFDLDSLSDLVMHVNFTAREGGPDLRRARHAVAQAHLPADGLRFFDLRHEMPEAWAVLRRDDGGGKVDDHHRRHEIRAGGQHRRHRHHPRRAFRLALSRQMFPFLNSRRRIAVVAVDVLLDVRDDVPVFQMRFTPAEGAHCPDTEAVPFVRTAGGIWRGGLELARPVPLPERGGREAGAGGEGVLGTFEVPAEVRGVTGAWVLCRYEVVKE